MSETLRVLRVVTNDGSVFHSEDWGYALVDALEAQADKRHGGVYSMSLVKMTQDEYSSIPVTGDAAELFNVDPHLIRIDGRG